MRSTFPTCPNHQEPEEGAATPVSLLLPTADVLASIPIALAVTPPMNLTMQQLQEAIGAAAAAFMSVPASHSMGRSLSDLNLDVLNSFPDIRRNTSFHSRRAASAASLAMPPTAAARVHPRNRQRQELR
jgi:hypothetical protein